MLPSKDLLVKTSTFLKKDIQYILDKKKAVGDKDSSLLEQLDREKQDKIQKLEKCTKELKELVQNERDGKKQRKIVEMATRAVDTIEYTAAKKKNNVDPKQVLKEREEARNAFQKYQNYEEKYNTVDPKDVPAFLFLHDHVLQRYGICPFLKMDVEGEVESKVRSQRLAWLAATPDGGKVYFDMYERVIAQKHIDDAVLAIGEEEAKIEQLIQDALSPSQHALYTGVVSFLEDFTTSAVKTKKIKERYKDMIHKVSILFCETQIPVHTYLGEKFGQDIMVNDVQTPRITASTPYERAHYEQFFTEHFNTYKSLKEQHQQQTRYIANTLRYTKNELYLFLTDQKQFVNQNVSKPAQQGKYFKKWSELEEEEKLERFASFAEFHAPGNHAQLSELLKNAYMSKELAYRDFKWNAKKGILQQVKGLSKEEASGDYKLAVQPPKEPQKELKKSVSKRSVLDAEGSDEILNDEILLFILDNLESEPITEKTALYETLKARLNVKRLTANDVMKIDAKLAAMMEIVNNSK